MICGLKWKTCNCPWFNYDAIENDRLEHMRVPAPVEGAGEQREPAPRPRRLRVNNYHDEMNLRRRQERHDEELARRLQQADLNGDDNGDEYQGGIGDIHGVGNGAGHFMNQNYIRAAQNILTGNFDQATAAANYVMGVNRERGVRPAPHMVPRMATGMPPQPPLLRRHTAREQAYNSASTTRPSERVVPRRNRTDYASEAAVHAPLGRIPQAAPVAQGPRPAVLAGLAGAGRGSGRVNAWRTHVEPGVPPGSPVEVLST